ncbi:31701_t:CDS:2, partial [Racocetra persica]
MTSTKTDPIDDIDINVKNLDTNYHQPISSVETSVISTLSPINTSP